MFLFIAFASANEPVTRTLPAAIPALHIENPAGNVVIAHDPGATETVVTATPVYWPEGCGLDFAGDMSLARIAVVREGGREGLCTTDLLVVLAGDASVAVDQRRGYVEASNMRGSLSVELGAGRIRLADVRGPVDVEVGLGGAKMVWTEEYGGSVAARVKLGRVRAEVPYGTWLNHDVKALVRRNPIPEGLDSTDALVAKGTIVRVDTAQSAVSPSTLASWNP
jgi:hypothetical protein